MITVEEAFQRGLLHDLDWICGSPVPTCLTADAERFRWLAARELAYDVAVRNGADPAQVTMFVTMSTRSLFLNPDVLTFGDCDSLASMLEVKCARDAREARRRIRRESWRRILGRG